MAESWLERFSAIRQWSRGGERAPHKPLLLLYVLGRLQRTGSSATVFADAEDDLDRLLADFGPPRSTSAAYPFHYLQSDGFWTVTIEDGLDPGFSLTQLRASQATGRLDERLEYRARGDAGLIVDLARGLLDDNWPPSLHADIAAAVGLELGGAPLRRDSERRPRDPGFRERVLIAYEYHCAFCGYDGRLGRDTVGLEAAHVRWHAHDGPDAVENALCLCSLHHKLLDLGAMGLTRDHSVAVSATFVGRGETAERMVLDLVGASVREPQPGQPPVGEDHIDWHRSQVFRGSGRQAAGTGTATGEAPPEGTRDG